MPPAPSPIVLIQIDEYSRLSILQTTGVRIGFIDYRVERDVLTVMPEVNQAEQIMTAISGLKLVSPKDDDLVKTASATIMRIGEKRVIVARGPKRE